MKLSQKKKDAAYAAIHEAIVGVRLALRLPDVQDAQLAQVEHALWLKLKKALGVE